MLTLVIILQLLDLGLTLYGFKKGFKEGNPLLVKLQGLLGRDGAIILTKAGFIALLLYFRADLSAYLLTAIAVGYAVVCWRNWRIVNG